MFPVQKGFIRSRERWRPEEPGFGIWAPGFESQGPKPESRHSCRRANDPRPGEAIVKAAMVAAEEGRQKSEPGRRRQHEPHELAEEGMTEIQGVRFGRHHTDAGGHLAQR